MSTDKKSPIPSVVLLGIIGAIGIFFLIWLGKFFWDLDKTIQASLIGAFVAIFSILITFWKERSRSFREAHREQKIAAYSIFYEVVFDILQRTKDDKPTDELVDDPKFKDKWMNMTKELLFYGSPEVLTAFNQFKNQSNNDNDPSNTFKRVGEVLLAMREDIGLSNKGLNSLNIHQIYVNEDVETAFNEYNT